MHAELQNEPVDGKPLLVIVGTDDRDLLFLRSLPERVRKGEIVLRVNEGKKKKLEIFEVSQPDLLYVGPDRRRVKRLYGLQLGNNHGTIVSLAAALRKDGYAVPTFDKRGRGKAVFDYREARIMDPLPECVFSRRVD